MGWVWIALLALAVAVLIGAEWPRLTSRISNGKPPGLRRAMRRRRSNLRVVEPVDEQDEFAASVQRDLEQLPTIKERDRRKG